MCPSTPETSDIYREISGRGWWARVIVIFPLTTSLWWTSHNNCLDFASHLCEKLGIIKVPAETAATYLFLLMQ